MRGPVSWLAARLLNLLLGRGQPETPQPVPQFDRRDDPYFRAFTERCLTFVYGQRLPATLDPTDAK